jgi:hypothetical protein
MVKTQFFQTRFEFRTSITELTVSFVDFYFALGCMGWQRTVALALPTRRICQKAYRDFPNKLPHAAGTDKVLDAEIKQN